MFVSRKKFKNIIIIIALILFLLPEITTKINTIFKDIKNDTSKQLEEIKSTISANETQTSVNKVNAAFELPATKVAGFLGNNL